MKSSFCRSVAVLSSGQSIAAVIPILAAPILGRLYLPAEYGLLGAYMAMSSVLAGIGNWQYSQAVIIEKKDNSAEAAMFLCVVTSSLTGCVALLIGIGITFLQLDIPDWAIAKYWFLLLPFSVMSSGIVSGWMAMANRRKQFRSIAKIQIVGVSVTCLLYTSPSPRDS